MHKIPTLSVVLPSYNNGAVVPGTVEKILDVCPLNTEIIVVVDGSTDGSRAILTDLHREEQAVHAKYHESRRGKGASVRDGMRIAHGTYVAFADADMSVHPRYIRQAVELMEADETLGMVIGWRERYHALPLRKIAHTIFHMIGLVLLGIPFRDTQAPMKVFRASVGKKLFSSLRTNGYAFDVELLLAAMERGVKFQELRVVQKYTKSSMRPASALLAGIDIVRIYQRFCMRALWRTLLPPARQKRSWSLLALRHILFFPLSCVALPALVFLSYVLAAGEGGKRLISKCSCQFRGRALAGRQIRS